MPVVQLLGSHALRRSLALAAALGAVAGASAWGAQQLLSRQAAAARRVIGKPLGEIALDADKVYRKRYFTKAGEAVPIELAMFGDSIAAGLGATVPGETLGARLSKSLGNATKRPVRLRTAAVVGSESSALPGQLATLPPGYRPDLAVIIVGGNDVTHRIPTGVSIGHLTDTITHLHGLGTRVVVGTCPDLGLLRPVPQPLRSLVGRASRQLATAQQQAALGHGAHVVSLSAVVGPFFISNPDDMFSLDQFHPSALGYKRTAQALLPSLLAALGLRETLPLGHTPPSHL